MFDGLSGHCTQIDILSVRSIAAEISHADLFYHPFSSYSRKVLIALYETDVPFTPRPLLPDCPQNGADLHALWPLDRFPVLRDGDRTVVEATAIIEHLGLAYPGRTRLITDDAHAGRCRVRDRIFDNYVMTAFDRKRCATRTATIWHERR